MNVMTQYHRFLYLYLSAAPKLRYIYIYLSVYVLIAKAVEVQILREKNIRLTAEEANLHHLQQKNSGLIDFLPYYDAFTSMLNMRILLQN